MLKFEMVSSLFISKKQEVLTVEEGDLGGGDIPLVLGAH